jgi:hypothetical protein
LMGAVIREDPTDQHRHLICYNWPIIYRPLPDAVVIVAIVHGARLLPSNILAR